MINLYISTEENVTINNVSKLLADNNVECQVAENRSCYRCGDAVYTEKGFQITFQNLPETLFKTKVWDVLQPALKLNCGFVIDDMKYMGCVKDWPSVFRKSHCPYM